MGKTTNERFSTQTEQKHVSNFQPNRGDNVEDDGLAHSQIRIEQSLHNNDNVDKRETKRISEHQKEKFKRKKTMYGNSDDVKKNCLCFRKQEVRTQQELYDNHLEDKEMEEVTRTKYLDKIIQNGYSEQEQL